MTTTYVFTDYQLRTMHTYHDIGGPRAAYRWYHHLPYGASLLTAEVEDLAVQFYSQYNDRIGHAF